MQKHRSDDMGFYISAMAVGAAVAVIGIVLALMRAKIWYILSVLGTAVFTVFLVFIIAYNFSGISTSDSTNIEALENLNWRSQREYSSDYQITDDMSICVSPLENVDGYNGYAVYDTSDGERIGSLIWYNDKAIINSMQLQIADKNSDGSNDIGVVTEKEEVIWFEFNPDGYYSAENIEGCFKELK